MRLSPIIVFSLILAAATLCAANNGNGNGNAYGKTKYRGKKEGTYSLRLVGQYSGRGTSTIRYPNNGHGKNNATMPSNLVSITADVKSPSGATGTIAFSDMPLVDDHFSGTTTFNGANLIIVGRLDMPANTDPDQTPAQKVTGRVSALLTDSNDNGARLVAIENEASRGLISVP